MTDFYRLSRRGVNIYRRFISENKILVAVITGVVLILLAWGETNQRQEGECNLKSSPIFLCNSAM